MHLSKIAKRLSVYFGGLLVIFAVLIGIAFYQLLKTQTINLRTEEMRATAERMAEVVSDNIDVLEFYHGPAIARSRLSQYLDNVAQEHVWVLDETTKLTDNYRRLPKHIKEKVEDCFRGQKFTAQDYSPRYKDTVLTVGSPVKDRLGRTRAVVLLHAPVQGIQQAVYNGLKILAFSLAIAFILGLILSTYMARIFTKPLAKMESIANELGEENYAARCEIKQNDEIGSLANTLDTLAERLDVAKEQRARLEKMRRQFISNITHELRTPLTVVLASLEALKLGVITEEKEVAECYDSMYKEGVFAKEMITDLLELSKLQNTDFPLDKQELNFVDVVKDAVAAGEKLAREKKISLTTDFDTEELLITADSRRLHQMLMVFITNAIKFSKEESNIEIILKDRNLTVTDHGCGMNKEMAEHAFEIFYTSHDERNKEGSGLGLAIARSIADRHGFILTLTSAENIGTTVRVIV